MIILFLCFIASFFHTTFAAHIPVTRTLPIPAERDLGGLFDDDTTFLSTMIRNTATEKSLQSMQAGGNTEAILGGLLTSAESAAKTLGTGMTGSMAMPTSHSTLLTSQPVPTTAVSRVLASTTVGSQPTTSTSMVGPASNTNQAPPSGLSGESTEWKVIGVVVISISIIGVVILVGVFWDQWTRCLRDMIFGKRMPEGVESLVPDWQRRSWEFKLANGESRYPSLETLSSEAQIMQEKQLFPTRPTPAHIAQALPSMATESKAVPVRNSYAKDQPGVEDPGTAVQLPSVNVYGAHAS